MKLSQQLRDTIIAEVHRRIIEESIPRIIQCISLFNHKEIWHKPNPNSNSMGVLVLHLCGNVRQWILSGACGLSDKRERDLEFKPQEEFSLTELIQKLELLKQDLIFNLPSISAENLAEIKKVQCYEESVITMLIHAVEHFSYHTGQIVYYTKFLKDVDTAFYADDELKPTS